jgi:NAD(P)-dependent dehydrogenase (short-subunit alcohol dehydrogenase family)
MNLELNGKLALVTGSTKGIGKAIVSQLLREGATAIVNGRSEQSVTLALEQLRSLGTIRGVVADLAIADGVRQLVTAVDRIGKLDILVNNVGFFEFVPFFQTTDREWSNMFDLNVMSGVRLARALMPEMLERGWGRMIFIASEAGVKPIPEMIHYSVTKTMQIGLARGLAELTKGTQVTVNSILAGPTWTEGVEVFLTKIAKSSGTTVESMKTDYFKTDGQNSLIQRFIEPEEIADLVAFLCSENASAINGSSQRVEGGLVRSIL